MNLVVIFFIIMALPGKPPITHDHQSASLQECMEDVAAILNKISPTVLAAAGGSIQVGCFVRPEKENDTLKQ